MDQSSAFGHYLCRVGSTDQLLQSCQIEFSDITTSRKHRVTVATLTLRRDRFLAGGEAILKSRETAAEDEDKKRSSPWMSHTVSGPKRIHC